MEENKKESKTSAIDQTPIVEPLEKRELTIETIMHRRNFNITAGTFSILLAISLMFTYYRFIKFIDYEVLVFFSIGFLIFGISILLFTYLQYTTNKSLLASKGFKGIKPFETYETISAPYLPLKETVVPESSAPPVDPIKPAANSKTKEIKKPEEVKQINHLVAVQLTLKIISEDLENISERIKDEIYRLTKSANVNLVFGSLNTIAAIIFLAYEVFGNEITVKVGKVEMPDVLAHYIPRLSLVIFIEIFAFFFLKIYKANLSDIKYFSNEKTNIEQKLLALKIAVITGNTNNVEFVVKELAKTERNFILKKGESTIELEKEKNDLQSNKSIFDALKDLIKLKG